MTGHKSFKALSAKFDPAQRVKIDAAKLRLRREMTLAELRQARQLTQEALGATLHVGQPAVAKLEKRTDMYVGNLRASCARWAANSTSSPAFPTAR